MDENQINSMKRELFKARWFIAGLEMQIRDSYKWDEDKHKVFIESLRDDLIHIAGKLDIEQLYREHEELRMEHEASKPTTLEDE